MRSEEEVLILELVRIVFMLELLWLVAEVGDQPQDTVVSGTGHGGGTSGESSVVDSCNRPGGVGTQTAAGANFIYESANCYVNGGFGFGGAADTSCSPEIPICGGGGGWYGRRRWWSMCWRSWWFRICL